MSHEFAYAEYRGWKAVWSGGIYIDVINRGVSRNDVKTSMSRYGKLPDGWAIAVINTSGDLDESDHPKGFRSSNDYVLSELKRWVTDEGSDYIESGEC
ncbi:hypothetical protein [Rhodococcus qingshengii]|uniref:hypothetical protein n=1 Tax=Rhodococcus qingshengii TaxID=334542 RepID=UPI0035DCE30E